MEKILKVYPEWQTCVASDMLGIGNHVGRIFSAS